MIRLRRKLQTFLVNSWLGGLYLNFLIWRQTKENMQKYETAIGGKPVNQIIREYSLIAQGVSKVKRTVNSLIGKREAQEYHKVLSTIDNMVDLAQHEEGSGKSELAKITREIAVKKGNVDIATPQEKLSMINKRIDDYKELHAHQAKRNLLRQLRKARAENNQELVKQLEQELQDKHGQRH